MGEGWAGNPYRSSGGHDGGCTGCGHKWGADVLYRAHRKVSGWTLTGGRTERFHIRFSKSGVAEWGGRYACPSIPLGSTGLISRRRFGPQSGNEKRKREAAIETATRKGKRFAKAKVKRKKGKMGETLRSPALWACGISPPGVLAYSGNAKLPRAGPAQMTSR